jgi:hypothetical protein
LFLHQSQPLLPIDIAAVTATNYHLSLYLSNNSNSNHHLSTILTIHLYYQEVVEEAVVIISHLHNNSNSNLDKFLLDLDHVLYLLLIVIIDLILSNQTATTTFSLLLINN